MWDWHFISVDWIEVVGTLEVFSDPVAYELISVETIVLPLGWGSSLSHAQDLSIEFFGLLQIVNWNSQMEWVNFVWIIFNLILHYFFNKFLHLKLIKWKTSQEKNMDLKGEITMTNQEETMTEITKDLETTEATAVEAIDKINPEASIETGPLIT